MPRQDPPSTCDLLDERPELGCCVTPLRSFGGRSAFSGEIATVSCFEDNVVMRDVLARAQLVAQLAQQTDATSTAEPTICSGEYS